MNIQKFIILDRYNFLFLGIYVFDHTMLNLKYPSWYGWYPGGSGNPYVAGFGNGIIDIGTSI